MSCRVEGVGVGTRSALLSKSELNIMLGPSDLKALVVRCVGDSPGGFNVERLLSLMRCIKDFEESGLSRFPAACFVTSWISEVAGSGSYGHDSCSRTAGSSLAHPENE